MKILNAEQVRQADRFTIEHRSVPSIELMERAAHAIVEEFTVHFEFERPVYVFCGNGNNGGDGLAVARLLKERGYKVSIILLERNIEYSEDAKKNLRVIADEDITLSYLAEADTFDPNGVIVDAIFGTGLNRKPEGIHLEAINKINSLSLIRVAIDLPSGLFADQPTEIAVHADLTMCIGCPKLSLVLSQMEKFVGEWVFLDIGLDEGFIQSLPSPYHLTGVEELLEFWDDRAVHSHKGNYGHALIIAGEPEKTGAALLASFACIRSGAGKVSAVVDKEVQTQFNIRIPEVMLRFKKELKNETFNDFNTIAIGPGLGTGKEALSLLKRLLSAGKPLVLDADALNLLAANPELKDQVPAGSILTPHPGEFSRLAGEAEDDFQRLSYVDSFCRQKRIA